MDSSDRFDVFLMRDISTTRDMVGYMRVWGWGASMGTDLQRAQ